MKDGLYRNIGIGEMSFKVPSCWNALTVEQLRFLAGLLESERTSFEVCLMMLLKCIGGRIVRVSEEERAVLISLKGNWFMMDVEQASDLAATQSYLFDDVYIPEPHITSALTVNQFPEIRRGGVVLTGPADGMLEIPFGRYIWLQTYLSGVRADAGNLNLALASLWHSSTEGDEPTDEDASVISSLPAWQRMVMFWYVSGCLSRIQRLFPRVFSGGGGGGGNVLDQQLRLLDSLAGSDMTKKEQVRKGRLIDALYVIDESVRKMEEREREMNRKKT